MSNKDFPVIVIGAGVSGISVGITFLALGFPVTIYTKEKPQNNPVNPLFSSLYPAASIIPHTVFHPRLNEIFRASNSFFAQLHKKRFPGLSLHHHFELFGFHEPIPEYTKWMDNFEEFDASYSLSHPSHPSIQTQCGWMFNCYFADWSIYFPALLNLFLTLGGEIVTQEIKAHELTDFDAEVIINCAEIFAPQVIGEPFSPVIYKGHLLTVKDIPAPKDKLGRILSYNFTPGTEIYSSDNGLAMDVYAYPRSTDFVLGGSRLKGTLDNSGNWIPIDNISDTQIIAGENVPTQILELNRNILSESFGIQLSKYPNIYSKAGYRYMGNGEESLRIDSKEVGPKTVINNFGHGGAGVTLGWGCAFEVLNLFCSLTGKPVFEQNQVLKAIPGY